MLAELKEQFGEEVEAAEVYWHAMSFRQQVALATRRGADPRRVGRRNRRSTRAGEAFAWAVQRSETLLEADESLEASRG